jgi:hypothetical protein
MAWRPVLAILIALVGSTGALPPCSRSLIGLRSSVSGNTRSGLPRTECFLSLTEYRQKALARGRLALGAR